LSMNSAVSFSLKNASFAVPMFKKYKEIRMCVKTSVFFLSNF
jgi:hypothetical protein